MFLLPIATTLAGVRSITVAFLLGIPVDVSESEHADRTVYRIIYTPVALRRKNPHNPLNPLARQALRLRSGLCRTRNRSRRAEASRGASRRPTGRDPLVLRAGSRPAGLEPATPGLEGRSRNLL